MKISTFRLFIAAAFLLCPVLKAQESVMVLEAYSGKVLVASNAGAKRSIGSLTKIAAAIVAVDWATTTGSDLANVQITVPQTITRVGGSNPLELQPGDQISMRDALYAMLLASDNLAALSVADHVGRSLVSRRGKNNDPVAEFVGEMNRLAKGLGMTQTRFGNPHGLDRSGVKAYSTAADVARLSVYAMRRNAITFITRQEERQIRVTGASGARSYQIKNTNELAGETGILGLKTGTTAVAGPCVAVCMDRDPLVRVKRDGSKGVTPRRLIVVVLNSPNRFDRARGLLRQGWSVYDSWLGVGAPVQDKKRELILVPNPS